MQEPYYQDEACTIYHGDCRAILPELGQVDLVLTDPPYGIDVFRTGRLSSKHKANEFYGENSFEAPTFLFDYGEKAIIWGANNWCSHVPDFSGWLVWYKRDTPEQNGKWPQSDAELAWTNITKKVLVYHHAWSGASRKNPEENGITLPHPTQKPLDVMHWCLRIAGDLQIVLDPFMGSGTTLRAAKDLGRQAIGIEIEERYCEVAAKRLRQEVLLLWG
jgi:site-specific DNA-methyltransferase (adenine-specific)